LAKILDKILAKILAKILVKILAQLWLRKTQILVEKTYKSIFLVETTEMISY
jgi:hypothetical protein